MAVVILALVAGACAVPPSASIQPDAPRLTFSPENEYLADNCLRHEATRTDHAVDEAMDACGHRIALVPDYMVRACHDFHTYRFMAAGRSEQEALALSARERC